ncbi:MAG: ribonuclease PH [Verrucomicrobiae bacterium]|nr:ribonuclease PH [Verrucomicrobiae bacterium]
MSSPKTLIRADKRGFDQLRPFRIRKHFAPAAAGSVLVQTGRTHVICAVSVEESIPRWMKEQKVKGGWLTAEYSMLPYSTGDRKPRDISRGKLDGRSQEIQRLIGRSLRAVVDLDKLGERTLWVDCDVLQADGGTRTASITGAYAALELAVRQLLKKKLLTQNPIREAVAAVSVGMVDGQPLLDLCYVEDKDAAVDMNVVMTSSGRFIELQGSGEEATFSEGELEKMLSLARKGVAELIALQRKYLKA